MPYFKCFIEGQHFSGQLINKSKPIGFYVTRFVEATSVEEAEQKALENLKQEDKLKAMHDLSDNKNARVYFDTIEEITKEDVPDTPPGFSFFDMDDDKEESFWERIKKFIKKDHF